ncbi:MAG: thioredoxin family protein [Planctomycetota bacterium]|nr:thioredoxin family protein [Planctomycetota bacterium]MDA1250493.1 thioredoxin family protein [Planctomycetota bacterium]
MKHVVTGILLAGLFFSSFESTSVAGEFNPVLDIGDKAPAWKKLPGVDGKEHSLEDLKKNEVVVVFFTCNSCPYAVDYEDRVLAFAKKHSGKDSKVGLVAINVNLVEEDLPPAMKKKVEEKGFKFPYLFDESQQIAKDFGAGFTPEFFVLNKDRKVVYMGAFDDSPNADKVKTQHVENAVAAALAGKSPAVIETVPIGCRIRIERRRRKRTE